MEMRRSKVLDKLRAGKVVGCMKLNLNDARVSELAAMCGFDCIWVGAEHVPTTWPLIEGHVRAAKMYDVDTMVRIPRGAYSDYIMPLEMDATGIMVPHVMSAADARDVVRKTRFHPIGLRPWDGGNSDGKYCMLPPDEYREQANSRRFVVVQIEDPEPMEELEEIAQVEGIDMLLFGAGDYSQAIGLPGQFDHPKIMEARKRVAQVARANGKAAAALGPVDKVQEFIDMGYNFISLGADVAALGKYFTDIATEFNRRTGG